MYKIISGGQTGADQIGLSAALESGLETGGWAPKGFMTFKGPNLELETKYKLVACEQGYTLRTKLNVQDSDVTFLYCDDVNSVGTKLTIKYLKDNKKPYFINWFNFDEVVRYILSNKIRTINIAGNRDCKMSNDTMLKTRAFLIRVFTFLRNRELRRDQMKFLETVGQLQLNLN